MARFKLIVLLSFAMFCSGYGQLTIIVDQIPSYTPPDDPIHIAGDFQGWDPGSPAHILVKDEALNKWSITLPAGLGSIEFKFTRGSWIKVETDADGGFLPNRMYSGSEGDTIVLQILGWEDIFDGCVPPPDPPGGSTAADNVHILSDTFYMPQFDRCRRVWVYLPPDYDETDYDYPVLYMHDGQNVFDAATSFAGEWEVDETLNRLHEMGDTGIIVVAVDNGGVHRSEEYLPWTIEDFEGRGDEYAEFIVEDLKPVVDATYRTRPGRESTGIMGSSFGGVISTYTGIEYQDVFSKIGSFSPSYWVSEDGYHQVTEQGRQGDMKIYQNMGTLEGADAVHNMFRMEDTMHAAGFLDDEVLSLEFEDGEHTEWFWAREFEDAYLWLFRDVASSASEIQAVGDLKLYPNPAIDRLFIEFEIDRAQIVECEIFNSTGQLIQFQKTQSGAAGVQQISVVLNKTVTRPGSYFCRVKFDERILIKPFVIVE